MENVTQEEYCGTWLILFDDGTYLELYGTEKYVDEWIHAKRKINGDTRTYRKAKWDD